MDCIGALGSNTTANGQLKCNRKVPEFINPGGQMEYHKGNVDPTNDGHPLLEVDTAAALGHLNHDERADLQILLELKIKVFNLSNK